MIMRKAFKVGPVTLTLTDIILIKVALSLAIAAAYFVPAPWHIPVGIASNMFWMWRL